MEDGRTALIWTPTQGEIHLGDVIKGSKDDQALYANEEWQLNALVDEGEGDILESFFRNNYTPVFYIGLSNDGAIIETDSIAQIGNEQTGTGYSRIQLVRGTSDWGVATLDGGDMKTTSALKTFSATAGDWIASTELFLCDQASGTAGDLHAWVALSQSRTLGNGDSLDVTVGVKLA
jgi:hypothetical protein